MKTNEQIDLYFELDQKIRAKFGFPGGWHPICNYINNKWYIRRYHIFYFETEDVKAELASNHYYQVELLGKNPVVNRVDGLAMTFGFDNGEQFYLLLKEENEIKNQELIDLINDL